MILSRASIDKSNKSAPQTLKAPVEMGLTPAASTEFIESQAAKWKPVVEATGLKIE